ncbi:MAG: T9SS type A sorting domain-containing protein [Flavobacteriales bacterium]|nr:T9SS type A sorting domain-containing protein [Flavobacteriales bacterium]
MKHLFTLVFLFAIAIANGQISQGGEPLRWGLPLELDDMSSHRYDAPEQDWDLIQAQDEIGDQYKDIPYRFGIELETNINVLEEGLVYTDEDDNQVIFYEVHCENATSVSMIFDQFFLPKGAELYVWNADRTEFLGSFNHKNNKEWGTFALGLVHGSSAILELQMRAGVQQEVLMNIGTVVYGYRSVLRNELQATFNRGPFGNSGNCNINVNCPEGDDWELEATSVGLIVDGGSAACTGAMVNNTAQDGTPYFLTANHCLGGQNNWVFYFNHQSAGCNGSNGPTNQSISGSTLRASNGGSDFALLELSQAPPAGWGIEFCGWDNSDDETLQSAVGIHHPSGDVKKICFEDDAPYQANTAGAAVWFIDEWEDGVTEPGSSGSPLFDQNKRIIGQLYGGAAACSGNQNNGQFDYYGRLGVSWNGNSASTRLRDWLDPLESGATVIDSWPTGTVSYALDAAASGINGISETVCGSTIVPSFNLFNPGENNLTSATIQYELNGGGIQTIDWTGNLSQFQSATVNLPELNIQEGNNTLVVSVVNPNNGTDENDGNNSTEFDFQGITGPTSDVEVEITLDDYGSETTWEIVQNGDVLFSGGPYADDQNGTIESLSTCLADGCYEFIIYDSFGDGICCDWGEGGFEINEGNTELASGGEFGDDQTVTFCVGIVNVEEQLATSFSMYPNPADEELTLQLDENSDVTKVQIINSVGQTIVEKNGIDQNTVTMDLTNVPSGWYIVRVVGENTMMTQPLIKK